MMKIKQTTEEIVQTELARILYYLKVHKVDVNVSNYPMWYQVTASIGAFQCIIMGRKNSVTVRNIYGFHHYKSFDEAVATINQSLCLDA